MISQSDLLTMQARLQKNGAAKPAPDAVEDESTLHGQIADYCRGRGWLAFHGAMHRRSTRSIGEPDYCILADNGRVLFFELKSKNGKLSPEQNAVILAAKILGTTIHVCRSMREFCDIVKG